MNDYSVETLDSLCRTIANHLRKTSTLFLAIDGPGGSGKSTLARSIAQRCPTSTILQMDDFFLPTDFRPANSGPTGDIGSDQDWRRMRDQVLTPLSEGRDARYQRYDWASDNLQEWHDIPVGGIVIIEGVYSLRQELRGFHDLRIWVDCPKAVYLARGLERSLLEWPVRPVDESRALWEDRWIPAEERYAREHRPRAVADIIIDTSGRIPVDVASEVVRVGPSRTGS